MLDLRHQPLVFLGENAAFPKWVVVLGAIGAVALGVTIGRIYWRQFRRQARMVELETRRAQTEFDLVSRDVIKVKQDVTAQLASRDQKI